MTNDIALFLAWVALYSTGHPLGGTAVLLVHIGYALMKGNK